MNQDFVHKLVDPETGASLQYDRGGARLSNEKTGRTYPLNKGVAILLPEAAASFNRPARQHEQLGSDFHYVEHYQRDAEVFDYFQAYDDPATRHENRRLHETITAAAPRGVKDILDVGCGNAWAAAHFCPRGVSVCSMDIALVNPIRALENYPYDNHQAVVADVFHLPFKPRSFDCIIAAEIIEHVPDPAAFIQVLLPLLRPGGKLLVTTPFNERIQYSLCIHCNRPTPHHAHLHSFTEAGMLELLPEAYREKATTATFGNKALIILPTHIALKYLPHRTWRLLDRLANRLLPKPSRILLEVTVG